MDSSTTESTITARSSTVVKEMENDQIRNSHETSDQEAMNCCNVVRPKSRANTRHLRKQQNWDMRVTGSNASSKTSKRYSH